jgi:hypothetical protein
MQHIVRDEYLRFAIHDAMRGVKLAALKRALTEDERRTLSDRILAKIKQAKWEVSSDVNYESSHTSHFKRRE